MSWDYLLTIGFHGRSTAGDHFVRLAAAIETNARFGTPFRFRVYRGHPHTDAIEEVDTTSGTGAPLNADRIAGLVSKYGAEHCAFEAWWPVERLFWTGKDTEPERDSYRAILYGLGAGCDWPPIRGHAASIVFDAGDHKHYDRRLRGHGAAENLKSLLDELSELIPAGIRSIHGLDTESSPDPAAGSLCFHSKAEGFLNDLARACGDLPPSPDLTFDTVRGAVARCDGIECAEPAEGLMVYSAAGTGGRLRPFFHALRELIDR